MEQKLLFLKYWKYKGIPYELYRELFQNKQINFILYKNGEAVANLSTMFDDFASDEIYSLCELDILNSIIEKIGFTKIGTRVLTKYSKTKTYIVWKIDPSLLQ